MSDDPYLFPGTTVLKNKLDVLSAADLDRAERGLVADRTELGLPTGRFDLAHLQAIHRHLFQDIYEWAGQIRTVEISKGGHQFQFRQFIETGMADVHRRIVQGCHFQSLNSKDFAARLGEVIGDVNYVHPFREGNGRTQLQFARQLADKAGYSLDLTRLNGPSWMEASRQANDARYEAMAQCFEQALTQRARLPVLPDRSEGRDDGDNER